eukprot:2171074-Ditylum_brightwellii.AAC.1
MPSAKSTLRYVGESSMQSPSQPTLKLQQQAGIQMKRTFAVSNGLHHVSVKSSMPTMNSLAE